MRQFVKQLLAVLIGNAIFFGLFFIIFILGLVGLAMKQDNDSNIIVANSILKIKLPMEVAELPAGENNPFLSDDDVKIGLHQITESIARAADDSKIKGLIVELNVMGNMSYQQLDLIRNAILDFKKSKKPTFAYGELSSQKMYYLASACDNIYLNPHGGMDMRGFGAQLTFFKNTIDRLEIEPQIFYAGKFKSATEPYRFTQMTEENKEQVRAFMSDFKKNVLEDLAKSRKIDVASLDQKINQMELMTPEDALKNKLIDGIYYVDEVERLIIKKCNLPEDKKINIALISDYVQTEMEDKDEADVAVYIAEGDIIDGKGTEGSIGSKTMIRDIRKIKENEDIKAVVLRINSPGGSALASAVILREIEQLKLKKPVVVSMGNVAASGGYYIASCGSKIFAERNTITGSIGVFSIIPNLKKFMENKLGLTYDEVELNDHAVMNINKPLESAEAAKIQMETERVYNTFKSVVAKSRKMSMESVENIAQGRVWSGTKAKEVGLVDEIGTMRDAIMEASKLAKCKPEYAVVNRQPDFFETLKNKYNFGVQMDLLLEKWVKNKLGENYTLFKSIEKAKQASGIQAKMPFELDIK
jgi:protease-4